MDFIHNYTTKLRQWCSIKILKTAFGAKPVSISLQPCMMFVYHWWTATQSYVWLAWFLHVVLVQREGNSDTDKVSMNDKFTQEPKMLFPLKAPTLADLSRSAASLEWEPSSKWVRLAQKAWSPFTGLLLLTRGGAVLSTTWYPCWGIHFPEATPLQLELAAWVQNMWDQVTSACEREKRDECICHMHNAWSETWQACFSL